jgi:hypothetical protein
MEIVRIEQQELKGEHGKLVINNCTLVLPGPQIEYLADKEFKATHERTMTDYAEVFRALADA